MTRNHSTTIFLVNQDVRAVAVIYEDIDLAKDTTKMKYTPAYLSGASLPKGATVFKTMDKTIKIDDFVTVPTDTRLGMTVCKVVAVDVEIDFGSDKECHWIVGTVKTTDFEAIRQWEEQVIVAVKASDVNKQREDLSKELQSALGDSIPKLALLTNPETKTGDEKEV